MCCKGCLNWSNLTDNAKNPLLLPTKHHFAELLIIEWNQAVHHNGIPEKLAAVRERVILDS